MGNYTIGELAKLADISVKTLRFYDDKGLLTPEARQEGNSYRYYSDRQVEQAQVIKEMKALGFSLQEIKDIVQQKSSDLVREMLGAKIQELDAKLEALASQAKAAKAVYHWLEEGKDAALRMAQDPHFYPVDVYVLPPMRVLYTRYPQFMVADTLFTRRCLELQKLREKQGLFPCGPFIGIFYNGYEDIFSYSEKDLELCQPVMAGEAPGAAHLRDLGGFLVAATIHVGHYRDMLPSYQYLDTWVAQSPYTLAGPPMAQYLVDPSVTLDDSQYVTRILFPIRAAEEEKT